MSRARAAGLLLGYAADRLLGDPRRGHPVAGFGKVAGAVERVMYADSRARGAAYTAVLTGGAAALGLLVETWSGRRGPIVRCGVAALVTWAVLGGRSLDREAAGVVAHLEDGDLPGARRRLTHLVGRETAGLCEPEIARAVVESVAENTSDAVVAPLVWGGLLGVPGLLGYRAANTLDAMVGHRTPRNERFGWASARLDDVLNLVPARLTASLAALCAPAVGGGVVPAAEVWRRDATRHPSPNAGPVEAAFAGALGVRLGGSNSYAGRVEDRHALGDGPPPRLADVARARRLAALVGAVALAFAVTAARLPRRRPRPPG